MTWDFDDYSALDSEASIALLLSERSQGIILAALKAMDFEYAWSSEIATWDDTEAALGEAYKELLEAQAMNTDSTPVGMVAWFPVSLPDKPEKWLLCDGSSYDAVDYPELHAVLHTSFVPSSITFNVPDLSERFLYGVDTDGNVGTTGGASTHALTIGEIPAHSHTIAQGNGVGNTARAVEADAATPSNPTQTTSSVGGGGAHNNMPPYMRGYWFIKALP